jgi:hypothetical protein
VLLAIAVKRIDSKLAEEVGVGVGATTGTGVTIGVGVGAGVGLAATLTPLFQTSLFPDLTQVYLIPFTVEVKFSFEQVSPRLTAALAISKLSVRSKVAEQRTARNDLPLLMGKY